MSNVSIKKSVSGIICLLFVSLFSGFSESRVSSTAPFSPLPAVVHGAGPVSVDVTVGPSVRPVVDTAINLADRKVRGLEALASTWNGSSRLVFDASVVPGDPAVESQRGLGMLSAILGRFGMRAAFGVRGSDPDASVRQMQRWGTPVSATPDPVVAASAGTPVGTSQPPVAPVAVVPVYVAPVAVFRVGGLNFRAVSAGSAVLLAGGVQRFEVGSPDPASPGLPDVVDGPRVVSLHVDPEGLLKASGYSSIDYLKHIVDPLAGVDLDLYFEAGRFLADGRVRVR